MYKNFTETLLGGTALGHRRGRFVGRNRTADIGMTFDSMSKVTDGATNVDPGKPLGGRFKAADYAVRDASGNVTSWVQNRTFDSTGSFYVGELERLDQELHMPLASVSWGRDIDLREDVTIADEASSFTISTFASASGLGTGQGIGNGKAWSGRNTTQVSSVSVDIGKKAFPLRPWDLELKYTIFELESAAKMGRPIDQQKFEALQLKHQMDIDEQVYIGDTSTGDTGMVNNTLVTNVNNVPNGAGGTPQWSTKSPDEILADFNSALVSTWSASAWAVVPSHIGIPPAQFGYIATAKVSQAGNMSILKYIQENNLLTTSGRGKIKIYPMKWLIGAGVNGTIGTTGTVDRMMVYTKERKYLRYPMTMLQRTPVQYDGIYHKTTYYCKLGCVEVVYPETVSYWDGI